MSTPHSAISISAIGTPTPGIVHRSSISWASGAVAIPILASMFPIARSSASMWASSPATRTPWWPTSNLLASAWLKLRDLLPHPSLGELGQDGRVGDAREERL
jgi:hypothetical protein